MEKFQIGLYEKAIPNEYSIIEKLELAKEMGYDNLELSIDETDEKLSRLEMTETQIEKIKLATGKAVPIGSICLSAHRKYPLGATDAKVQERSLEIMEKAVVLASKLGVRVIQLAGYDVYYEDSSAQTLKDFETNLKKCVLMASTYGVLLGFETMETPFMDTVEKSMKYVNLIDSPYLHVYPDLGNLTNASKKYGHNLHTDIRTGKGRIIAMHIKETVPGVYRDMFYGDGEVDFNGICPLLKELNVTRFVTEFWDDGKGNHEKRIKDANIFIRNMLENGGI